MKIMFIGAAHEVTGSCTYIEVGDKKILVDYGMEQGINVFENAPLPVGENEIDLVFLTHAHVDHSGHLPLLYKNGFRGDIFSTNETANLCNIMLRDCAHIQESEAKYKNRKRKRSGSNLVEPLYSLADAENVCKHFRRCEYQRLIQVNENITVRFTDIGHLLGSACIEMWLTEDDVTKKIVFSGDVGNTNQPIIKDPDFVSDADYLVIESTYGDRLHTQRRIDSINTLADHIERTLSRGGNLIIPSFAVGRTQEMLYFIREIKNSKMIEDSVGDFPVYVDSPLANEATSIYQQCDMDCLDDEILQVMKNGENPLVFSNLHTYVTTDESMKLNSDRTPKVIISASGMCEAGRVCHHLKYNLWRKECTILFVGYQAVGTLGRLIHDGATSVRLFKDDIAVNAEICTLQGVSGHADKDGLINWLSHFEKKPLQVFVNHGDESSADSFVSTLKDLGYNAFAPFSGTTYDLKTGEFIDITQGVRIEHKHSSTSKSNVLHHNLIESTRRLTAIAKDLDGIPNKDIEKLTSEIEKLILQWKDYKKI
ncbi:MAG: MBL fold metallo-hydrolase [Ruminococcus sp.]|nr:MBL fold metallo-hydrolase [Ruminococcus sp.]